MCSPRLWAYLDVVATCAALAFLLLIVRPAYQYAYEESFITTPALQIQNVWRASALPVGICLMALFALLRLARVGDVKLVATAVISVAVVIGLFWLAQPWFRPLGNRVPGEPARPCPRRPALWLPWRRFCFLK